MVKRELLIIDAQYDFCDPRGALYVQGAEKDSLRLASFIKREGIKFDNMTITLDSHHLYDIAHPLYWQNDKGDHPDPFTLITEEDILSGKWQTSKENVRESSLAYVRQLEKQGKYVLCIWPPHCLIGSEGTSLQKDIFQALLKWETFKTKSCRKVYKGLNSGTEHYGAFEAEVPLSEDPHSGLQQWLIDELDKADEIYIAGEALDYCVANTIRQLADHMPSKNISKIILLEDCVSSVDETSGLSKAFLDEMIGKGMRLRSSTDEI